MKEVKEIRNGEIEYQITVEYTIDWNTERWNYSLLQRQKGKRKWTEAIDTDSYMFRKLSMEDRRKSELAQIIEKIGVEELQAARIDLWNKIKPGNNF